jgi:hypothetical protein
MAFELGDRQHLRTLLRDHGAKEVEDHGSSVDS